MAQQGHVVETRADSLPAELGGPQEVTMQPAEMITYEPVGITSRQVAPDTWEYQFLISPFKMISIRLNAEGKALLLSKLTGGIVIPS